MIYLGSDHAGYELKQAIARHLAAAGQPFKDVGNSRLDPHDDYPDYAFAAGEAVAREPGSFGILACGSAQGICMAANKVKGARAVAAPDADSAKLARADNDANILCLSGWKQAQDSALATVEAFISEAFSQEPRHSRRLEKISSYERGNPSSR